MRRGHPVARVKRFPRLFHGPAGVARAAFLCLLAHSLCQPGKKTPAKAPAKAAAKAAAPKKPAGKKEAKAPAKTAGKAKAAAPVVKARGYVKRYPRLTKKTSTSIKRAQDKQRALGVAKLIAQVPFFFFCAPPCPALSGHMIAIHFMYRDIRLSMIETLIAR